MTSSGALPAVHALVEARRFDEAAARLIGAAGKGESAALFELAQWRVFGSIVRRDLPAARRLMGEAAAAGERDAALIHAAFLANGTGGAPDWAGAMAALERAAAWSADARGQLALLAAMDLDGEGNPTTALTTEVLSETPRAWAARGVASAAECDWLAARSRPFLRPSVVVDPATGQMVPNPVRTSDGAALGVMQEDAVVVALNRRVAALTATPLAAGEPLQILRYLPGAEYKAHFDALPPGANQRIATVILYLNHGYEGGETAFLRTGLSFRGRPGDALFFMNVLPDGAPDPVSLHAGLPVRSGEKLVATRWIREKPFTFPPPEPITGRRFD
jgi:prolyl 4-hydroxylase